ncbi:hypothetical protein PRZ48_007439 [Zasmidium cellare]|uniref:Uncharacterized protein n=1 Tax=Zasmidium cellare TaxID=395010 RepID=A0ABR0EKC2_ZASCE|nr:hypothetical protein PRZ48_007439 [Zasmidium cellare]
MGDPAEPYLYPDLDLDLDPDLFVDMPPWTMDDLPDAVLDNQRSNQAFTKAEMEESLSSSTSQLDCVSRVAPIEDLDRVQDLGLALTANAQVKWSAPTASIGALVRPRNLDTASTANALIHEHESASCQPPTLDLSSWPQAEPPEMQAMSVKDNFDPAVPVSETFPDELILPAAATKVAGDSDCSWTDGDQEDQWSIELQSQLIRFREQQQRTTTVTSALPGHQRRKDAIVEYSSQKHRL